jgi:capsular exopolysaccharide synthesis family protein
LNTALGGFIGLLVALLFVLLRATFNTRVGHQTDVARLTGVPRLGTIVKRRGSSPALIMLTSSAGSEAEAYRKLRTDLQFVAVDRTSLALVVTSSVANEGKSTITCNLALAMIESGVRVLLIDADLRKPSVAKLLSLEGAAGLTTVLAGKASFDDVVQRWGDTDLDILTSGVIPPNPSELLSSQGMEALLTRMRKRYDVVLIDTPPSLAVADPAILARLVDGALVIADTSKARVPQLRRTVQMLGMAGASVLGIVLNRVKSSDDVYVYEGPEIIAPDTHPQEAPADPRSDIGLASTTVKRPVDLN